VLAANASNSATIKHWISHECDKVLCVHACTVFSLYPRNGARFGFPRILATALVWLFPSNMLYFHKHECCYQYGFFQYPNAVDTLDFPCMIDVSQVRLELPVRASS